MSSFQKASDIILTHALDLKLGRVYAWYADRGFGFLTGADGADVWMHTSYQHKVVWIDNKVVLIPVSDEDRIAPSVGELILYKEVLGKETKRAEIWIVRDELEEDITSKRQMLVIAQTKEYSPAVANNATRKFERTLLKTDSTVLAQSFDVNTLQQAISAHRALIQDQTSKTGKLFDVNYKWYWINREDKIFDLEKGLEEIL